GQPRGPVMQGRAIAPQRRHALEAGAAGVLDHRELVPEAGAGVAAVADEDLLVAADEQRTGTEAVQRQERDLAVAVVGGLPRDGFATAFASGVPRPLAEAQPV